MTTHSLILANTVQSESPQWLSLFVESLWTGRLMRQDKRGYIPDKEPKIISKLGIDTDIWMDTVKEYSESYHAFVGSEKQLKEVCESTGKKWLAGIKISRTLYC